MDQSVINSIFIPIEQGIITSEQLLQEVIEAEATFQSGKISPDEIKRNLDKVPLIKDRIETLLNDYYNLLFFSKKINVARENELRHELQFYFQFLLTPIENTPKKTIKATDLSEYEQLAELIESNINQLEIKKASLVQENDPNQKIIIANEVLDILKEIFRIMKKTVASIDQIAYVKAIVD